jgi:hypothetical protein
MSHHKHSIERLLFLPKWFFSSLSPCWFFIRGGKCHKPPSYAPYKGTYVPYEGTFGMPDQGQTLDVWESQTTKSALRWLAPYCSMSYSWSCSWSYSWSYSWTHVLRTKTMTSLILDPVTRDHLYLGINTGEKDMFLELSRDHDSVGIVIGQIKTNSTPCGPSFVDPTLSLITSSFHVWYHNHYFLN